MAHLPSSANSELQGMATLKNQHFPPQRFPLCSHCHLPLCCSAQRGAFGPDRHLQFQNFRTELVSFHHCLHLILPFTSMFHHAKGQLWILIYVYFLMDSRGYFFLLLFQNLNIFLSYWKLNPHWFPEIRESKNIKVGFQSFYFLYQHKLRPELIWDSVKKYLKRHT